MPLLFNHSAALTPSLSKPRARSAPPGAMTIAAPVARAASGRNTVSVGSLTFEIVRPPAADDVADSGTDQDSEPGALAGQRRISWDCAAAALSMRSKVAMKDSMKTFMSGAILPMLYPLWK